MPIVMSFLAYTIALDFTNFATFQQNSASFHSRSLGWRCVTTLRFSSLTIPKSRSCTNKPPLTRLKSSAGLASCHSPQANTRTLGLVAKIGRASSLIEGAIMTSTN